MFLVLDFVFSLQNIKDNYYYKTYGIAVRLIGLELLVIGELYVDRSTTQLSYTTSEVCNHCHRRYFLRHFKEGLDKIKD